MRMRPTVAKGDLSELRSNYVVYYCVSVVVTHCTIEFSMSNAEKAIRKRQLIAMYISIQIYTNIIE